MPDERSNSADQIAALLTAAKEHAERGDEHYRAARDAIVKAKELDPGLSNRAIARAIGRSHRWVNKLLQWNGTAGSGPFAAQASQPVNDEPVAHPILQNLDVVVMGEHVLVVGDSTHPGTKLSALSAAGLPFRREFFDPDAVEEDSNGDGEMDVAVVTDPPYGQGKDGIANDHQANWSEVYRLFRPRGGFVFCAYKPPYFRAAEDGIIAAGGVPIEYLALDKGGGRMWGGDRVQNRIDGIIYFERGGHAPWPAGRRAASLLRPERSREAMEERRRIAGGHPTPKYIDVLVKLVALVTEPGGTVLDPFTGSGTTLIACERTGRRFIGVELEAAKAERAVRNWLEEAPGEDAIVHREFADEPISFTDLENNPGWGDYEE